MKKLLSVILVLSLMLSMLVACGSNAEDTDAEGQESKPTTSSAVSEKEESEEEESSSEESSEENSSEEEESSSESDEDEEESSSSKKSSSKKSSKKSSSKKSSKKSSSEKEEVEDQEDEEEEESSVKKSSSKKSSSKKSSSKKSSSKKSSSKKSSSEKVSSAEKEETPVVKNVSDFKGTWKLANGSVFCCTIDDADNTVTAYAENGFSLGTYPVVATEEGIVLKMGALGLVTLKDPSTLAPIEVPAATDYSVIVGVYEMIYGEHVGAVLDLKETNWTIDSEKYKDTGNYEIMKGEAVLAPTKELGGSVYHKILGGGKILQAYQPSSRIYVEKSFGQTPVGKALTNYYDLIMNDWTSSDYDVEFTDKGRVLIAGEDMGIWYPTSTGATAEFTDGSTQYVEFTDSGIKFFYNEFARK